MKNIISLFSGLLFGVGLGIGGMTDPSNIQGFLDIFGNWNPTLMGVMIGAIAVHSLAYLYIKGKPSPLLDTQFHLPTSKDIDARLIAGAALFGLGWGWAGICPGPAIASLASGDIKIIVFVLAMLAGMLSFQLMNKK